MSHPSPPPTHACTHTHTHYLLEELIDKAVSDGSDGTDRSEVTDVTEGSEGREDVTGSGDLTELLPLPVEPPTEDEEDVDATLSSVIET